MKRSVRPAGAPVQLMDPMVFGALCGMLSAVGYTAANVCLRQVALDNDPVWVSCLKAVPTVVFMAPWVLFSAWRGAQAWMSPRALGALVAAGVIGQLAGNVAFQWALGVIGLAICVPLTLGTIIIAGAVLGRIFLLEPVTPRSAAASVVLLVSIVVLSFGSGAANESVQRAEDAAPASTLLLAAGVGAACLSGVAYAVLGVVIRRVVTRSASLPATLLVVCLAGVVVLAPLSVFSAGVDELLATSGVDLAIMLLAGVFNALAFFALGKSLQLIPVLQYNLLNASQTALAAVAGILFFQEAATFELLMGVVLTIVGLLLLEHRPRASAKAAEDSSAGQDDDAPVAEPTVSEPV